MGFDQTTLFAIFNSFYIRPLSHYQAQSTENNTFSGSGFSRNNRKSRTKRDIQFIDKRKIFDIELC